MTPSMLETPKPVRKNARWLALGLLALTPLMALPGLAQAQGQRQAGGNYDGYCYQEKDRAETRGAVTGLVVGALLGNAVAGRGSRGEGTALGAVAGTMIGASAGSSSIRCSGDRYYSYDQGYYAPPPPPPGEVVVYYRERPRFYDRTVVVYEDAPRYYSGRTRYVYRDYDRYDRYDRHDRRHYERGHDRGRW